MSAPVKCRRCKGVGCTICNFTAWLPTASAEPRWDGPSVVVDIDGPQVSEWASSLPPASGLKTPGKPRVDLLPPRALMVVAKTLTDTAGERDKDGPGYLNASGADITEYKAALGRHWLQYMMGIGPDDRSGVSHLAHVIANAAILLELQLIQAENSNTEDG